MLSSRWKTVFVVVLAGAGVVCQTARALPELQDSGMLFADDGTTLDLLGVSLAMDQGIVISGAQRDDDQGMDSGSAYLFDVASQQQIGKLLPEDGEAFDMFGYSVAIEGSYAAVGVPEKDDFKGAVYIFDVASGEQLHKLTLSEIPWSAFIGVSLAIEDGILAVGGTRFTFEGARFGAVHLFDVQTGEHLRTLAPAMEEPSTAFGASVAMHGGLLIAGAPGEGVNDDRAGCAYLFDISTGEELRKFAPLDGDRKDYFGSEVAIGDGVVCIGAPEHDGNGSLSGAAYLYRSETGEQYAKLIPSIRGSSQFFGSAIAIEDDLLVVGAPEYNYGRSSGVAYLFQTQTGQRIARLVPRNQDDIDHFARSIGMEQGVIVGGAYGDFNNGQSAGSLAIFQALPTCDGDVSHDNMNTLSDLNQILNDFGAAVLPGSPGDFDGSGTIDLADLNAVLSAFGTVCP